MMPMNGGKCLYYALLLALLGSCILVIPSMLVSEKLTFNFNRLLCGAGVFFLFGTIAYWVYTIKNGEDIF